LHCAAKGPLSADTRDRILSAVPATIENWLDRPEDAPRLDALFAERPVN
jgi:hypothetical protein